MVEPAPQPGSGPATAPPEEEGVYSSVIVQTYCRFIEREFGKRVLDQVLDEVGFDIHRAADINLYHPPRLLQGLRDATKRITGRQDIAYQAGRTSPQNLPQLSAILAGFTTPDLLMKRLARGERKLARKTITQVSDLGRRRYHVQVTFRDGFREARDSCLNRLGMYEALPRFFGLPYARVEHPRCAFRGDPRCEYLITLPSYGFLALRRLAGLALAASAGLAAAAVAAPGGPWPLAAEGALVAAMLAYGVYAHLHARISLRWSILNNEGLVKQNLELERNHERLHALHSLTHALSQGIKVDPICDTVVGALVRDFGYDSSQIWLLEPDGRLLCRAARGYAPAQEALIRGTSFRMGERWDNRFGFLIQTLEQGKTLLINDVEEAISKLSESSQGFFRGLGLSSFIMAPLLDQGRPVGLVSGEHHRDQKVGPADQTLFQSISHIATDAILKAGLFEGMERKIEERSQELERAHEELLAAKEMAIQAEKLSSLGQMAAGVAHEINNPLNFLVNILPDLRRDMDALQAIRDLLLPAAAPDLRARAGALADAADLDSHLGEKEYVFGKIAKALDKSTRIANSLKVFSRSAAKEKVAPEGVALMLREVLDLIPAKNKGSAAIALDVPEDIRWEVNRNEVEQVFVNLINNAIDAMGQAGRLEIQGKPAARGFTLAFRDHGPGMPPEVLRKIFDPFYTTKPPGKGTGLGLTIATEIVRKYGGRISVESQVGQGTTFTLHFSKPA